MHGRKYRHSLEKVSDLSGAGPGFCDAVPALVFMLCVLLASCGGSGDPLTDHQRSIYEPEGFITLHIKDTPVIGARKVVLTVQEVQLQPVGKPLVSIEVAPQQQQFELLALEGAHYHTLLEGIKIPSGDYQWVKLIPTVGLTDSYVETSDGGVVAIGFPQELIINEPFTHFGTFTSQYLVDVDLSRGLIQSGGDIALRPTLHIIKFMDDVTSSFIKYARLHGVVDAPFSLACADFSRFAGNVYLYQGALTTPTEMDQDSATVEPYAVARVSVQFATYDFGYLAPGSYTVAYSCDEDDPDIGNEAINFAGTQTIELAQTQLRSVNFRDSVLNTPGN